MHDPSLSVQVTMLVSLMDAAQKSPARYDLTHKSPIDASRRHKIRESNSIRDVSGVAVKP
jgi:hypothetical protein